MKYAIALEKKLSKNADPRGLPQHRLLRRRRVRRRGRGPALLRHPGGPADAAAGGHCSPGVVQRPGPTTRSHNPTAAHAAPQRRPRADARDRRRSPRPQHDKAVATQARRCTSARTGNGCDASKAAFFCNYVYQHAHQGQDPRRARRPPAAELIKRGGLTVRTTLDQGMQARRAAGGQGQGDGDATRARSPPPRRWSSRAPARCWRWRRASPTGERQGADRAQLQRRPRVRRRAAGSRPGRRSRRSRWRRPSRRAGRSAPSSTRPRAAPSSPPPTSTAPTAGPASSRRATRRSTARATSTARSRCAS